MASPKADKPPPRDYVQWEKKPYITDEKLEELKKDHPEAFIERNSVRPDRIQIDGLWFALELSDGDGTRHLVRLK